MPTGDGNDTLPVRKATKAALASAKRRESFDDLLRELLAAVPPDVLRARLDAREATERRRLDAVRREPRVPRRGPEKQLLIAAAAERRWRRWLKEGRVTRLGPRRYRWEANRDPRPVPGGVRLVRRPGRGLTP